MKHKPAELNTTTYPPDHHSGRRNKELIYVASFQDAMQDVPYAWINSCVRYDAFASHVSFRFLQESFWLVSKNTHPPDASPPLFTDQSEGTKSLFTFMGRCKCIVTNATTVTLLMLALICVVFFFIRLILFVLLYYLFVCLFACLFICVFIHSFFYLFFVLFWGAQTYITSLISLKFTK